MEYFAIAEQSQFLMNRFAYTTLLMSVVVLITGLLTAPEGYEDESGFHFGVYRLPPLALWTSWEV